ncbi:MAG: Asp-tRNA(Asn)/Glu-tRNA(Gln) amidotransferase subunit GatB [Candidatus Nomurabacteria bacterium]|nr:Asp-tRNA(Asn)/Glu-tRNA(Gln) amidotransferase subunit GatB [Candidatus Nomurabacteria bacterium]USN88116.1 MAG: Asp-tRNA(Asn)/Glu-tRNA(Gln) amidotransferase subunit GatB [Candidatus Nomurabacteria bacterium]
MSKNYTATIGLEVHAELKTESKMFCGCKNDPHNSQPNLYTCPICLGHPGTLPAPNEDAVAKVLLFGKAVNSSAATYSEFDRKNYFYPDIPKAYQISQYAFPFLTGGVLADVELTRVHLEEDTARSQHDHDGVSLVDFNRAGVPLMELVTEPVIHDAGTAGRFARELQLLLQTINISDAQMERGEMRIEANISVSKTDKLGTKVEVKNLNSFKSVESAIAYEVQRQIRLLEEGGVVEQETRGWDEVKLRTYTQRKKESAKDYRYFPDPDLTKINTPEYNLFSESRLSEILPVLPNEKRLKYSDIGLPAAQIELIISTRVIDDFFCELLETFNDLSNDVVKLSANYLTSDILSMIDLEESRKLSLSVPNFAKLMIILNKGSINSRVAKHLLRELLETDFDPEKIAEERGLLQTFNPEALLPTVREIIAEFPEVVADYKAGKEASIQFLVGQGMKKTKGAANPGLLLDLLRQELK